MPTASSMRPKSQPEREPAHHCGQGAVRAGRRTGRGEQWVEQIELLGREAALVEAVLHREVVEGGDRVGDRQRLVRQRQGRAKQRSNSSLTRGARSSMVLCLTCPWLMEDQRAGLGGTAKSM